MPDFNALLMQGFQTGRELRRQEGESNALAGLVGGDRSQISELARYNPQAAMGYQRQQQQQQLAEEKAQQAQVAEGQKLVGQAALLVAQQPDEPSRAAAWDAQIDALSSQYPGLAQYKGKYSPQALQSVIAQGGLSGEYIQTQRRDIVPLQAGGSYVTKDYMGNAYDMDGGKIGGLGGATEVTPPTQPQSAPQEGGKFSDFNGGMRVLQSMGPQKFVQWQQSNNLPVEVTSKEQMDALPSGALVVGPGGVVRRKP